MSRANSHQCTNASEHFARGPATTSGAITIIACIIISIHVLMVAWTSYTHTPIASEMAHLAAGLSHHELNHFDLLSVNPPLIRYIATIPVWWLHPNYDWYHVASEPLLRAEHAVGRDFVIANGSKAFDLLRIARATCLPFTVLCAIATFHFSRHLWGSVGGLTSLVLYCFSPSIIGHAALMLPDVHGTVFALAACYSFHRWLIKPTPAHATTTAVLLALAELCKATFLILYPAFACLWAVSRWKDAPKASLLREMTMLVCIFAGSIGILNWFYGFQGSLTPLRQFKFHSMTLSNCASPEEGRENGGNRFAKSLLGWLPVPLPAPYLLGVDKQKSDFELSQPSYLFGNWNNRGWWYYYPCALAIKEPLATWILLMLTFIKAAQGRLWARASALEMAVIVPACFIVLLAMTQNGFSHHFRYVIPALPFLYIWLGKSVKGWCDFSRLRQCVVASAIAYFVASSVWIAPHSYSYYNELVGGPKNGHYYLSQSNGGWGQDLFYLQSWLRKERYTKPIGLLEHHFFDASVLGMSTVAVPRDSDVMGAQRGEAVLINPLPGRFVINVSFLHENGGEYAYFATLRPFATIGYSYLVFEMRAEDWLELATRLTNRN
jgi:hypothetical protein